LNSTFDRLITDLPSLQVDIDQALAGIDRLLKSQELTFAFVGVAPALGLVYVLGGYLRSFLFSGNNQARFGGRKQRLSTWSAIRRVEHLLLTQPSLRPTKQNTVINTYFLQNGVSKPTTDILPLTAGLLLLSVTRLREYAETCLPVNSQLREGFLQDVGELESPLLGRDEKLQVINRMWRSWGDVLGWHSDLT
jgi:nuclear-control-of-ATPase protein 2